MSPQPVLAAGSTEPSAGPDRLHPTFITTWSCPYAQRTWIALNAKNIHFTPVFVDLQDKPEWFLKHNPYGRVPTLVWQEPSGQTSSLYESLICNEYLNDLEGPSLLPEDAAQRARARLIIDQFGVKFTAGFGKVMFASNAAAAASGIDELNGSLQWVEAELSQSEGPFFMGPNFTLVDAAVAPFVLRLKVLEGLGDFYKVPQGLSRFSAYCDALAAHPAVCASMAPPDSSRSWTEQLVENYKVYVARRKAAAN